jgi:hypothetical protein
MGSADLIEEMTTLVLDEVVALIIVVVAYGRMDATVDVAMNDEAEFTPETVSAPRKSESPATSKMLPVVDVALVPRRKTCEVLVG